MPPVCGAERRSRRRRREPEHTARWPASRPAAGRPSGIATVTALQGDPCAAGSGVGHARHGLDDERRTSDLVRRAGVPGALVPEQAKRHLELPRPMRTTAAIIRWSSRSWAASRSRSTRGRSAGEVEADHCRERRGPMIDRSPSVPRSSRPIDASGDPARFRPQLPGSDPLARRAARNSSAKSRSAR